LSARKKTGAVLSPLSPARAPDERGARRQDRSELQRKVRLDREKSGLRRALLLRRVGRRQVTRMVPPGERRRHMKMMSRDQPNVDEG